MHLQNWCCSIRSSRAPAEGEEAAWGWAVRVLWRESGQCAFLGEGRESSHRGVHQMRGALECEQKGLVPVSLWPELTE